MKNVLIGKVGAFALVGLGLVVSAGELHAQSLGPPSSHGGDRSDASSTGELQRDGLFVGMSFGRGSIAVDCSDCNNGTLTEALSLETHVGYMITPKIALVGEHWTIRYNARGGALFNDNAPHLVAQHVTSVGAQMFLGQRLWIRTGVGVGWHISDGDYTKRAQTGGRAQPVVVDGAQALQPGQSSQTSESDTPGGSYFAAVGWELAHSESFVAEVQLRAATTYRSDEAYEVRNVGLNVGASWY